MQELKSSLQAIAKRELGQEAIVTDLQQMTGGHAGLTYGFTVRYAAAIGGEKFVLKMGPRGVRRVGAADVFRQAELLRALAACGIPVPGIAWANEGETDLGAPYIVMRWMPGRECFPLDPPENFRSVAASQSVWRCSIDELVRLASIQSGDLPRAWLPPTPLGAELMRWEATLRKAPEQDWIDLGLSARDALVDRLPHDGPIGLVHGDFQPANLLFLGDSVSAVIDWDLAFVGDSLIDLGWLMMFADPDYWGPQWQPAERPAPALLAAYYAAQTKRSIVDATWYQAFAGYRFGAIACLNVRLHRTGRRSDAIWERFALDIPRLFRRAHALSLQCPRPAYPVVPSASPS
jgi:aminoglycoside phosphotransferase (APT) family kinase protein